MAKINRENVFSKIMSMDGKENKYRFVRHVEQLEGKKILIPSAREHGQPLPDPLSYNEEKIVILPLFYMTVLRRMVLIL